MFGDAFAQPVDERLPVFIAPATRSFDERLEVAERLLAGASHTAAAVACELGPLGVVVCPGGGTNQTLVAPRAETAATGHHALIIPPEAEGSSQKMCRL